MNKIKNVTQTRKNPKILSFTDSKFMGLIRLCETNNI